MLDPKFIRQNVELVRQGLASRSYDFDLDGFLQLDGRRRELQGQIEELLAAQNKLDKEVKALLKQKKDPQAKIAEAKGLKAEISSRQGSLTALQEDWRRRLDRIPNIPHASLPVGQASYNKLVKEVRSQRKFGAKPLDHIQLAEALDIIDFKRAAKISGSNFVLFKGLGAQLERALINFMLDLHITEHGYQEVWPPKLVCRSSMRVTGQLPNLEEDMYVTSSDDLFLIPTAEVPVTNIHSDEVLKEGELPINYVAYTSCFRREAGSYGKDTRGLMRVHEFDKVEMVKFVQPESSYQELEKLLADACRVLDLLELPYRVLLLATGDLSFAAAKCYDIELYAPGIDKWLEVSSCSNFEDFQARRGNIRYRKSGGKLSYVHTLNGSGLALARLVVAILENYQQPDGAVVIPPVLRRYLNGREAIAK